MAEDLLVDAFIEIPKYSRNKYEFDKALGRFRLDRVLYSPIHYPADYGYVPETLEEDGDEIDILVMVSSPTFPGCVVSARVIGALEMEDDKGVDFKLLSVSVHDPRYREIRKLTDVPSHSLREMEYFFSIYKDLEGKSTVVKGWQDQEYALWRLEKARSMYRERQSSR